MELCKEKVELQENCIEKNFNMVWDVIHINHFEPTEDNFQIGCIGLLKAYRKFDVNMRAKFSTFAYPCIKNEILMSKRKKYVTTHYLEDIDSVVYETNMIHFDHYNVKSLKDIIVEAIGKVCANDNDKATFYYIYAMKTSGCKLTQLDISKQFNIPTVKISRYVKKINKEIEYIINKDCF